MFTILTVVTSVWSLAILAAGREQRFRPLHGARALRGDFEGRREHSLNEEIISSLGLLSHEGLVRKLLHCLNLKF